MQAELQANQAKLSNIQSSFANGDVAGRSVIVHLCLGHATDGDIQLQCSHERWRAAACRGIRGYVRDSAQHLQKDYEEAPMIYCTFIATSYHINT